MRALTSGRGVRAGLVAGAGAIAFAIAASVGAAVSPTGMHSASHKYQYDKKVTICHRTGSKRHPFVTIRVSRSAVRRHLAHGDRRGPCSRAKFVVCHKSRRGKHTIKVTGVRALRQHLRHGDRLGPCSRAKFVVCHKSRRGKHTIKVTGVRALRQHLRHGDRLGSCKRDWDKDKHGRKDSDRDKGRQG